jgi:hypothetical protein
MCVLLDVERCVCCLVSKCVVWCRKMCVLFGAGICVCCLVSKEMCVGVCLVLKGMCVLFNVERNVCVVRCRKKCVYCLMAKEMCVWKRSWSGGWTTVDVGVTEKPGRIMLSIGTGALEFWWLLTSACLFRAHCRTVLYNWLYSSKRILPQKLYLFSELWPYSWPCYCRPGMWRQWVTQFHEIRLSLSLSLSLSPVLSPARSSPGSSMSYSSG